MMCVVGTPCCWLQDADQCSDCKTFQNGSTCVSACSPLQYPNGQNKCANCDAVCDGGCTGPGRNLGPGGCRSCHLLLLDSDGSTALECIPESARTDCFNYTLLDRSEENAVGQKVKLNSWDAVKCTIHEWRYSNEVIIIASDTAFVLRTPWVDSNTLWLSEL